MNQKDLKSFLDFKSQQYESIEFITNDPIQIQHQFSNKKDIEIPNKVFDQYLEIGKLVKQARIQKNISLADLSLLTKIPEQTINSIENNSKTNDFLIKL